MKKNIVFLLFVFFIFSGLLYGQDSLNRGLEAYSRGDWAGAVVSFKRAASENGAASGDAGYWLVMAETAMGDYKSALRDADSFLENYPQDKRYGDMLYQKGRILHLSGKYDDSIVVLGTFANSYPGNEYVSSAVYWIGENLYLLGRFDEAEKMYRKVLAEYPLSVKKEASSYKIQLIEQKEREEELLEILRWSHEESLKVIEEYSRRERNYEQALNAYQKKVSGTIQEMDASSEAELLAEQKKNAQLSDRIETLTAMNGELTSILESMTRDSEAPDSELIKRIQDLKQKAETIKNSGINLITMLTGIDDPNGKPVATDRTYAEIINMIFGTPENPTAGHFYYVTDDQVETTITDDIYNSLLPTGASLKDITITDYFPKEIIDNFEFAYIQEANIGEISAEVNKENNSITWTIPELEYGKTATVQYTLKLKENFDSSIVGKILDTNEKVDISYTDVNNNPKENTSDVKPKLKLSEPPVVLPKAGTRIFISLIAVAGGFLVYSLVKLTILNKKMKY